MPVSLGFLKPVLEQEGPFATVFMDASRSVENAEPAIERRWRDLRGSLQEKGAPEAVVTALDAVMGTKSDLPGEQMQYAIANERGLLLDERLPTPPVPDRATWAALPEIMPLLRLMPSRTPYLTVRIDRTGADIRAYGPAGERSERVQGDEQFPIHKVHAGGWSESRYQRSAEESWDRNARQVAEEVDRLAIRHGSTLLVVAGDVRARGLLTEALGQASRSRLQEIDGEITEDELTTRALERVREHDRAADQDLLGLFEQERGAGRRAVSGLAATAERLWEGQVQTLVLADFPEARTMLWAGPEPTQLATDEQNLRAAGIQNPARHRADSALIRATAATDGDVVLVDPEQHPIDDGVGAILRY